MSEPSPFFEQDFIEIVSKLSKNVVSLIIPEKDKHISKYENNWLLWEEHKEDTFFVGYHRFITILSAIILVHSPPYRLDSNLILQIEKNPEFFRGIFRQRNDFGSIRHILESENEPTEASDWPWLKDQLNKPGKGSALQWFKDCYNVANDKYQENTKKADITRNLEVFNSQIKESYDKELRLNQILGNYNFCIGNNGKPITISRSIPKSIFTDTLTNNVMFETTFAKQMVGEEESIILHNLLSKSEEIGTLSEINQLFDQVDRLNLENPVIFTNLWWRQKEEFFNNPHCIGFESQPGNNNLLGTCKTPNGKTLKVYLLDDNYGQAEGLLFDTALVDVNRNCPFDPELFPNIENRLDESKIDEVHLILSIQYFIEISIKEKPPIHFKFPSVDSK
ncbi:MAG: hypothetical protein OEY59_02615 [Deltaproteobacteria bacterium]|nr:hypothetical protein [Deltaproteobacteria bacterium]